VDGRAVGWAWDPAAGPGARVSVEILVDGRRVGVGLAELERDDLRAAQIGDGAHGFAIDLPVAIDDAGRHLISGRVVGETRPLTPSGGFRVTSTSAAWSATSFTPGSGSGSSSSDAPEDPVMIVFGRRISRDAAVYLVALALGLPLSLASVAVTTRYLSTADFGNLSLLFLAAGFLTVAYNLISLQGTFMWAVGGADEDGGGDIMADVDLPMPSNRRRALGSGIALSLFVTTAGTGLMMLLSRSASAALLGSDRYSTAIRWAALSAGFGALWRFSVNVLREERRPYQFAVMFCSRPILALALSVPLLEAGHGIDGVLAATALGTLASGSIAIWLGRSAYSLALNAHDMRQIVRLGKKLVPVILGIWLIHSVDLLALARYASPAEVGVYRIASRLGQFPSYVISAFLMALSPLFRTSLVHAAQDRYGQQRITSVLFTYFELVNLTVLVTLGLGADLLVHVAAASYRSAAPLIPLVGLGFVLYGTFYFLARYAPIANKMRWFGGIAVASSAVIGGSAVILIPPLGSYGAALSLVLGMTWAVIVFLWLIARSAAPIPFQWGRLGAATTLAAGVFVAGAYNGSSGLTHAAIAAGLIVGYPLTLIAAGIVPRGNVRPLLRMLRSAVPQRPGADFLARVGELSATERILLERIVRRREEYQTVAGDLALSSSLALGRTVRALRRLDGVPGATAADARIGRALLGEGPHIETDFLIRRLWADGVDPLDLHHVESAVGTVRRVGRRAWARAQRA
jgi:O-antigen/teichoic acid export membrane protein